TGARTDRAQLPARRARPARLARRPREPRHARFRGPAATFSGPLLGTGRPPAADRRRRRSRTPHARPGGLRSMRYLAAAGPPEALEEHLREVGRMAFEDLVPVIDVPGFAAWTLPGTPAVHGEDGRSLAVGLLFERASGRRMDRIPAPLPDERNFSARFWGAYVLFAMQGPGHSVLRDPSGNLTAYHRRMGPIEVYASDAALLAAASPAPIR